MNRERASECGEGMKRRIARLLFCCLTTTFGPAVHAQQVLWPPVATGEGALIQRISVAALRELAPDVYNATRRSAAEPWVIEVPDTASVAWREVREGLYRILNARPVSPADTAWRRVSISPLQRRGDSATTFVDVGYRWRCGGRVIGSSKSIELLSIRQGTYWSEAKTLQTIIGDPAPCGPLR